MVKKKSTNKKFYYVQCGDWDAFTISESPKQACSQAISQSLEVFQKKAKMTKVIICIDPDKQLNDEEEPYAFLVQPLLEKIHED